MTTTTKTTIADKTGTVRRRTSRPSTSSSSTAAAAVKGAISAGKGDGVFRRPQRGSNYIHWLEADAPTPPGFSPSRVLYGELAALVDVHNWTAWSTRLSLAARTGKLGVYYQRMTPAGEADQYGECLYPRAAVVRYWVQEQLGAILIQLRWEVQETGEDNLAPEQRDRVVAMSSRLRSIGLSLRTICETLGVGERTLMHWSNTSASAAAPVVNAAPITPVTGPVPTPAPMAAPVTVPAPNVSSKTAPVLIVNAIPPMVPSLAATPVAPAPVTAPAPTSAPANHPGHWGYQTSGTVAPSAPSTAAASGKSKSKSKGARRPKVYAAKGEITSAQAAAMCGIDLATWYRLRTLNLAPNPIRVDGRVSLYSAAAIRAWNESRRQGVKAA